MHRYGKSEGYIVWDARNGRVIPAIGAGDVPEDCVYTKASAEETARQLNRMVLRNTMPALAHMAKDVKGPFYARPASMRRKLEGKGIG